ncbi:MAG TPA: hypothetical protein VMW91_07670 [Desulfosporosinus sp.]|nr:hypothetical protein [Desulfosporosinus sp.]
MWKYIVVWIVASVVFAVFVGNVLKAKQTLASFEKVDYENKIVFVKLHEQLTTGSDGACQAAGMTILKILETLPENWRVHVTNEWVPSRENPIDIEWAKKLAEGY